MADIHLITDMDEDKDRNFITALARGLDVLRCFRPHESILTNTDIAKRTGLPKPTVSRLIYTLCKLDYLSLDVSSGGYRLGAGVLSLGFGVLSGMEIAERAKGEMGRLRDGPNSYITCALAERHLTDAIYIAVERSREDVSLLLSIGSRLPLFFSAIGRAILVGLDEAGREAAFACGAEFLPELIEEQKASYIEAKHQYETLGFCKSYGEWRPDVNGIAVPIRALDGRVFGLNVGGPSFHVKPKQLETVFGPLLVKTAELLNMKPQ
ncbi:MULTISPECIES: IclR family transcriptional regulator [Rhodobacterales]|uniref:IclR family transcriptional regulator n=1 Tax=Roseobacter sp. N2S TaxID=2663844 RepID=UPI0028643293|nr:MULTISPECIES: IclR family transcriptional regulator [Rhodobacterales]MDR6265052.1 DNA-binding IclR family transcriptional regulator [Roseobacter sp. N2S]